MEVSNFQLQLQNQKIDILLHFQSERLRNEIHEQRKQQTKALISNMERESWRAIREKEANLAEAITKEKDLEERVKKVETEKEAWKRMANTKEAIVVGLKRKLEEARERRIMVSNGAKDAESHYPSAEAEAEGEGEGESGGSGNSALVGCKSCNNGKPCEVLFLPCRHLCSCKYCEVLLGCCPVCHSVKEASLEVLFL